MVVQNPIKRLETGVRNLDAIFGGGLPKGSVTVLAGPPGSGKTILAQQIGFHQARTSKVVFFQTLSEPTVKTLLYLQQFSYYDESKLHDSVRFIDLGAILNTKGLASAAETIMEHVKAEKPGMVVIDSFRAFDDLSSSPEELRKFHYQLAVNLIAWECTALLLGEFNPKDLETNPLFSVIDALIIMNQVESCGEQQRILQTVKMRGAAHNRDKHPFIINHNGIEVYAPRVTLRRDPAADTRNSKEPRLKTGIVTLDRLLGAGVSRGSSVMVSGTAGTGKTLLLLEFIYRGAKEFGEKGIFISFEETEERLRATAKGIGWDLDREIDKGLIEILYIPQPDLIVESHLLTIQERICSQGVRRVAIDSLSGFLHKVLDPQVVREKVFQLATIVQNAQAVGLFATDLPAGTEQISRFGVEATIVDGVILLSAPKVGHMRKRNIEIYKLRNTAHALGEHAMTISQGGITVESLR